MRISSLQRRDVQRSEVEVESAWRPLAGSWLPSISLPALIKGKNSATHYLLCNHVQASKCLDSNY